VHDQKGSSHVITIYTFSLPRGKKSVWRIFHHHLFRALMNHGFIQLTKALIVAIAFFFKEADAYFGSTPPPTSCQLTSAALYLLHRAGKDC
jgi:hypothetical protein